MSIAPGEILEGLSCPPPQETDLSTSKADTTVLNESSSGRFLYLDALRIGLMTLGILYHAELVYGHTHWRVNAPANSRFFDYLVPSIHLFRMPAFFLISDSSVPLRFADEAFGRSPRRFLGLGPLLIRESHFISTAEVLIAAITRPTSPDIKARLGRVESRGMHQLARKEPLALLRVTFSTSVRRPCPCSH